MHLSLFSQLLKITKQSQGQYVVKPTENIDRVCIKKQSYSEFLSNIFLKSENAYLATLLLM